MGIWQQTRKMNSVIAVHRIFSCDSRAAKSGRVHFNSAASRPGQRHRFGRQAHLERDLTVRLRHLGQHVQHGLDQSQEADVPDHFCDECGTWPWLLGGVASISKEKKRVRYPPPLVSQGERGITPPRIRCVALLEMANADEIAGPSWYANQEPTSQEHTQRHVRFMSTPKTRCTTLLRRRSSTLTTGCRPGGWGAPESARSVALARDARRACLI